MNKAPAFVIALVLASLPAIGCSDPKAREIERLRAELEAARADASRARVDAEASRADLVHALAEAEVARAELARMRGEPVPVSPRTPAPEATPLEQRFASLKANYDKNAINVNEWGRMKATILNDIPQEVSPTDKRTLGQRLIDLKGAYDSNAINVNEWGTAKGKLIAQVPSLRSPAPALDRELAELKRAYDGNAINVNEWTRAKGEVAKWAR
jgi:hypothetical protein